MAQYKINVKAQIDKESLAKIQKDLANVGKGITISLPKIDSSSVVKLSSGVNAYTKAISNAEKATKKTSQSFSDIVTKVGKFSLATMAIGNASQIITDVKNEVLEFDKTLIEFTKVSDLSGDSLERYTERLKDLGKEVARTRTEMLQGATEFKKTGYSEEDALRLSHTASMFQNIADTQISTGEASKFLVSQMKAFNIEATDSIRIIDSVNEVANNFATGTNDIQSGLTKTASAMATMGNTFEESIGLMIPAMETMPNQAGKIARGLKSIGAEITKIADETGVLQTNLGTIKLKEANGELRSTFDIMKDLYPLWTQMGEAEKTRIGLLVAGKHQLDVFTASMNNFNRAIEAQEVALTSSGSAIKENDRYMQGIEARLNLLKAEFADFASKTINSDLTKSLISLSTLLLKLANSDIAQLIIKTTVLYGAVVLLGKGFNALLGIQALQPILLSLGTAMIGLSTGTLTLSSALKTLTVDFITSPFGIALTVVAGITAIVKVVDALTVSLKEQEAIVTSLTQEVSDLEQQQSNLASRDNLNENEQVKLQLLEAQLQAKKDLLKLEAEELVRKKYDTKSITTQGQTVEYGGIATVKSNIDLLTKYKQNIEELNQQILNLDQTDNKYTETLKTLSDQREGLLNKSSELTVSLTQEADFMLQNKEILGDLGEQLEGVLDSIVNVTTKKIEDNNATFEAIEANEEFLLSMEELNIRMDDLQHAYNLINEAQQSYAENGYISLDLGRKLTELSGEYLGLLFDENGGLVDVDEATRNYTLALIDNMMAKKALEILDTVTQTGAEKVVVDELGGAYDSATMSLWDFVVAQNATKDPFTLEILYDQIASLQKLSDSMKLAVTENKAFGGSTSKSTTTIDKNSEALKKNKDELEKHNKALKDQQNLYDKAYKYIESVIDKRIKKVEQQKKTEEAYWNKRIERLKRDQEEVKKNKEVFEKQNQALQDQIDLEERLQALAKAENTQVIRYEAGKGMTVGTDLQGVSDAQKSVDEKQSEISYQSQLDMFDKQIQSYDAQIENFEQRKEQALASLDEEIEHWNDYKNKWKETVDSYDMEQNRLTAIQLFGADVEDKILAGRLDIMEEFKTGYAEIQNAIVLNQEEIALIEEELGNTRAKNATDSANAIIRANNAVVESYNRMKKMKTSGTVSYSSSSSASDRKKYATGTIGTVEDEIAIVGDAPNAEMVIPPKYNGVEMALPKNTGVVPATLTENIMSMAKFGMNGLVSQVAKAIGHNTDENTTIQISSLSFPNMDNYSTIMDFVTQLGNFKNKAIQSGFKA